MESAVEEGCCGISELWDQARLPTGRPVVRARSGLSICYNTPAFGNGWAPVGPAVLKTVARRLNVLDVFDSHTFPPSVTSVFRVCAPAHDAEDAVFVDMPSVPGRW